MRTLTQKLTAAIVAVLVTTAVASAHHIQGKVVCDTNGNQVIDATDTPLNGIVVRAVGQVTFPGATVLDTTGDSTPPGNSGPGAYRINLNSYTEDYRVDLPGTGFPAGASVLLPPGGSHLVSIVTGDPATNHRDGVDFLLVGCTGTSSSSSSSSSSTSSSSSSSSSSTSSSVSSTSSTSTTSTTSTSVSTTSATSSTTSTSTTSTTVATTPLQFCEEILDHFKCYSASGERDFEPTEVELTDQFGTAAALLRRPYRFCNPVDKNTEGIRDPTAHLMCYQSRDAAGTFSGGRHRVTVTNQFGEQSLVTIRHESLCVPAEKNDVASDLEVDRFKCYRVVQERGTPRFTPREVTLADQFENKVTEVLKPHLLCNPVDLNGQGIAADLCHLLCYRIRDAAGQPEFVPVEVSVEDEVGAMSEVGTAQNSCRRASLLCVPSLKAER